MVFSAFLFNEQGFTWDGEMKNAQGRRQLELPALGIIWSCKFEAIACKMSKSQ